jgi:hypothetical protein
MLIKISVETNIMLEKRKRTPHIRSKFWFRPLLLGLLCIVVVIVVFTQTQSISPQIVYIAPDEEGIENVWLADLNHPEHPRQLTHFEEQHRIHSLQTSETSDAIFFVRDNKPYHHRDNQLQEFTLLCDDETLLCSHWKLHPDGDLVLFVTWVRGSNALADLSNALADLHVLDLRMNQLKTIFQSSDEHRLYPYSINWVTDTYTIQGNYSTEDDVRLVEFDATTAQMHDVDDEPIYCAKPSPDDTHCAYNISDGSDPIAPELVGVYEFGSSEQTVLPLNYMERPLHNNLSIVTAYFYDWHPDSTHFLLGEYATDVFDEQFVFTGINLNLYNVDTMDFVTLTSVSDLTHRDVFFSFALFNADGTKLLVEKGDSVSNLNHIILVDVATGEQTKLPIRGYGAQWVSGGN